MALDQFMKLSNGRIVVNHCVPLEVSPVNNSDVEVCSTYCGFFHHLRPQDPDAFKKV